MAYAWLLRRPSKPVPIAGSCRSEAMREIVAALDIAMTAEESYAVWAASTGHEVL